MRKEEFEKHILGIPEIDKQHLMLFKKLQSVKFNRNCKTKECYLTLIDELKDLVLLHFNSEEKMMLDIKFPFFIFHKREHERLSSLVINLIIELKLKAEADIFNFHINLIDTFQQAIIDHVDQYDSQISYFLNWKNKSAN